MPFYHVNPATGLVNKCKTLENNGSCDLNQPFHAHDTSIESIIAKYDAKRSNDYFVCRNSGRDPEFEEALTLAADGGFVRASKDYPQHFDAQVNILFTSTGITHLADKVSTAASDYLKNRYARTLAWVTHSLSIRESSDLKTVFRKQIQPALRTRGAVSRVLEALQNELPPKDEVVSVAGSMWIYRDSSFHVLAKSLIWSDPFSVSGYIPRVEKVFKKIDNRDTLARMNVDVSDLPENVLAFDIETDTVNGYGLRPTKTQITEIVISGKDYSWVIAGDERFILEKFASVLNKQDSRIVLAGWNNYSFDNITLQTRAEFHRTRGWGGSLELASNVTVFEPCGPTLNNYSMVWTTSDGSLLHDVDIFQEKAVWDQSQGERFTAGLKPFVESLDCNPVRLDRAALHEYSDEERQDYVLSDGICTLRAASEVWRLQESLEPQLETLF